MVKVSNKDTINGTTSDDYSVAIMTITDAARYDKVTIILENSGSSNVLTYKIITEAYSGGITFSENEADIATESTEKIILNNAYDRIQVYVKSKNAGSATTYNADYIGQYKSQLPTR